MNHSLKRNQAGPSGLVLGTGIVLIGAFLAIVLLFFIFASFSTAITGKCVAVVDVSVPLTVEGSPATLFDSGYPNSEQLAYSIESADNRDDVGALVLVFNSPGGSVVATREVYDAVHGLDKPSVSYFREVAASGAYYAATGSDYIISDPNALTGSIGVITTFASMEGLFDKLGINITTIKSGKFKDIGSPSRNLTDEEQVILQALVDEVYDEFRMTVLANRGAKLDMDKFNEATDGRVLSGRQAVALGLVDETGTKKDAILKAAELAGLQADSIEDVRICRIETMPSEGGLLGAEGLIRSFEMYSQFPKMYFK